MIFAFHSIFLNSLLSSPYTQISRRWMEKKKSYWWIREILEIQLVCTYNYNSIAIFFPSSKPKLGGCWWSFVPGSMMVDGNMWTHTAAASPCEASRRSAWRRRKYVELYNGREEKNISRIKLSACASARLALPTPNRRMHVLEALELEKKHNKMFFEDISRRFRFSKRTRSTLSNTHSQWNEKYFNHLVHAALPCFRFLFLPLVSFLHSWVFRVG